MGLFFFLPPLPSQVSCSPLSAVLMACDYGADAFFDEIIIIFFFLDVRK